MYVHMHVHHLAESSIMIWKEHDISVHKVMQRLEKPNLTKLYCIL